jgi:NADH-quinone oxidoreductase subunit I
VLKVVSTLVLFSFIKIAVAYTAKRLYAAQFDIDMAKCCFCGLCTTVCPTECLTMTNEYDYSTFERDAMNFQFADMTLADIALRKRELEEANLAKQAAKASIADSSEITAEKPKPKAFKPFKPKPANPTTEL